MRFLVLFLGMFSLLWWPPWEGRADDGTLLGSLDLNTAIEHALQNNLDLKAKRQTLGIAQGRVQQADLLLQNNPELSVDVAWRNRRFIAPTGRSVTDVKVGLLQEFEIAGQRGHRREAATKNLTQTEWSVIDAERLLRLEVTQAFYNLLALQEKIAVQREVLATQEILLELGQERFDRKDLSILDLDTLRSDRDRVQSDLVDRESERLLAKKQLLLLLGLSEERSLVTGGNLLDLSRAQLGGDKVPHSPEELEKCALENRPDLKAAQIAVEVRGAELRLAQAGRIPNVALGPFYAYDDENQVVGGSLSVPLPFFNRNQEERATTLANLEISRIELQARRRAVAQEVASSFARMRLAERRLASYGETYTDHINQSVALTRKAYQAGEISVIAVSVTQDRLAQGRFRYLDAALAYLQATADLEAQAFCTGKAESGTEEQVPPQ